MERNSNIWLIMAIFLIGCAKDADHDGYVAEFWGGDDCNDHNPDVYPGAEEKPSKLVRKKNGLFFERGLDDDCDGLTDEITVCWDGDHDGSGTPKVVIEVEWMRPGIDNPPEGYVKRCGDPDDANPDIKD